VSIFKTVWPQSDAIRTSNCIASNLEVNAIILSPENRHKMLHGHVLCTWVKLWHICKFWAVNCTKMHLAGGLQPDPLGELWRSPRPP